MQDTAEAATPRRRIGTLGRIHRILRSNWISSMGAAIATFAFIAEITSLTMPGPQSWGGPYIGILTVVALPALFFLGLLLIPIGLFSYRHQLQSRLEAMRDKSLKSAHAIAIITLVNLFAVGTAGTVGVEYMSSTQFCGKACHDVMGPEHATFLDSYHSNIDCVTCHVSPGAEGFIEAKLNGTKQLLHTVLDNYSTPIPAPVLHLPSTKDSCEKCHSARRYLGTKILVRSHYEEDEKNTGFTNVVLMRRGGETPDGAVSGIHWHAHPDAAVDFLAADEQRLTIPYIKLRKPDGTEKVFRAEDYTGAPEAGELRRMDCVDCHNRVGHHFPGAAESVDEAMSMGLMTRRLPYLKKYALEVLHKGWSRENAGAEIRKALEARYADMSLDAQGRESLDSAIEQLTRMWLRSNFPRRKLTWNSYPRHTAHDGCFRCHDGKHKDDSGAVLSNACELCHVVLSQKQEDPAILETLGMKPK